MSTAEELQLDACQLLNLEAYFTSFVDHLRTADRPDGEYLEECTVYWPCGDDVILGFRFWDVPSLEALLDDPLAFAEPLESDPLETGIPWHPIFQDADGLQEARRWLPIVPNPDQYGEGETNVRPPDRVSRFHYDATHTWVWMGWHDPDLLEHIGWQEVEAGRTPVWIAAPDWKPGEILPKQWGSEPDKLTRWPTVGISGEDWLKSQSGRAWVERRRGRVHGDIEEKLAKYARDGDWERVVCPHGRTIENKSYPEGIAGAEMEPCPVGDVAGTILEVFHGWPRRVGSLLFVPRAGGGIEWLSTTPKLFAWIGSHCVAKFDRKGCSKEEVAEWLRMNARNHDSAETMPHWPPLAGAYYAYDWPERSKTCGKHLLRFLDYFSPETRVDRLVMLAAILTPFWGGAGGRRPAFIVTAGGRGKGKSTFAQLAASLSGEPYEISSTEPIDTIKRRLLTVDQMQKRTAILDNVKSSKFSWADWEAILTARVISGSRNFAGEAERPNILTWFITANGASLSTDIADRAFSIRLAKPHYGGDWNAAVERHLSEHRDDIIREIIQVLWGHASEQTAEEGGTRWSSWVRGVLEPARRWLSSVSQDVPDLATVMKSLSERRSDLDVETEESSIVLEYFSERLAELEYSLLHDVVFIPSQIAARWVAGALGEKLSVTSASRRLRQLIEEGRFPDKSPTGVSQWYIDTRRAAGTGLRGFAWVAPDPRGPICHYDLTDSVKGEFRKF